MLSSEEKLQHFSQTIFKEAESQKREILAQAEKERQSMEEAVETQSLEAAYKQIQKKITLMQRESNETISRMQTESRRALIARREQMVEEIFAEVEKQLAVFRQSDAYPDFLERQIRRGVRDVGDRDLTIWLDRSDAGEVDRIRTLFPDARVELLPAGESVIGGARVFSEASHAVSDQTLSLLMEQERQKFRANSGLTI